MIDHDVVGAIVLILAALALLVWGIRRHLSQEDTQLSDTRPLVTYDEVDTTWDSEADRYHGSTQWGR